MMATGYDVVAEAHSWLGTPFVHQASKRGVGVDCVGLIAGVARELGLPGIAAFDASPKYKGYGREPDPKVLLRGCQEFLDEISLDEVREGDILLMRYARDPMHFAIVTRLDPMYVIHALGVTTRNVAEHRLDDVWRSRILRAYRYRGLE